MNKKKELRSFNHELVDYLLIRKNQFIVPRSLAERHAMLGVKVKGECVPAPVSKCREAGLSKCILPVLEKRGRISDPCPIQAQCLPCIMAGQDVIGIAKIGSGKTLAFVLLMLRHILDQPLFAPNVGIAVTFAAIPTTAASMRIHRCCACVLIRSTA
jgi:ATP-dependent RNA helicase DDX46/PRP5